MHPKPVHVSRVTRSVITPRRGHSRLSLKFKAVTPLSSTFQSRNASTSSNNPPNPNLDTSTPPRPRSRRPSPSERGVTPGGMWNLGPVSVTIALILLSGGAWFGYRWWRLSTIYPQPVRAALRVGIAASQKGDWEGAEVAFRQALRLAYQLPPSAYNADPLIKLTGIASKLGESLELAGKRREAYLLYVQTLGGLFEQFAVYPKGGDKLTFSPSGALDTPSAPRVNKHPDWSTVELDGRARLRAVGFANRAAMLAQSLQGSNIAPPPVGSSVQKPEWTKNWREVEMYLRNFSVTQVLYIASNTTGISTAELSTSAELDYRLPKWLSRMDLAAPCEGLADCYVRRGEVELALPLYQTAYHFLLSPSNIPSSVNISTTSPLATSVTTPSDPTIMCMAASVLTAMSAAVLGIDNPRQLSSKKSSSKNDKSQMSDEHLVAVRSWARESRRLTDLGRRVHGRGEYANLVKGVEVLGLEESKAPQPSVRGMMGQPANVNPGPSEDLEEKDRRLVKVDLERITEANRRRKEAAVEGAKKGEVKWGEEPEGIKGNAFCERTWAVVLYNTGMVEAFDGNTDMAQDYLRLALEQSRRINLLEGVERSKAALLDLVQGTNGKK